MRNNQKLCVVMRNGVARVWRLWGHGGGGGGGGGGGDVEEAQRFVCFHTNDRCGER